ncbi:MAG: phage integrase SAM-like domain-containing protein [Ekhidna sp.]
MGKTEVTIYFDTRDYSKRNNGYPVSLQLYHAKKRRKIKTHYYCEKKDWIYQDLSNTEYVNGLEKGLILCVSKKHPNARRINSHLKSKLFHAQQFLLNNETKILDNYPIESLHKEVQYVVDNQNEHIDLGEINEQSISLIEAFKNKIDEADRSKSWGIKGTYATSLSVFIKYLKDLGLEDIRLTKINQAWLRSFISWYKVQPNPKGGVIKHNTINKKLSQLKHVMRKACEDESEKLTWKDYPFHNFKLPKNKTAKRAMDISKIDMNSISKEFDLDQVANIMDLFRQLPLEVNSTKWHYRNYLLFMWDCRGMDFIDLAFLTRDSIQNKTLEYLRSKVQGESLVTIDLNEEALEILEIYDYQKRSAKELIFPYMREIYEHEGGITEVAYNKYRDKLRYFNAGISKMAGAIGLDPKATSKMIRHTWAQNGFEMFENLDLIGEGLGHGSNPKTTKIYARDLNRTRLVEANEQITSRKSKINSEEYRLTIRLYKNIYKAKKADIGANRLKERIIAKFELHRQDLLKLLGNESLLKWDHKIDQLSNLTFSAYEEVTIWIKENLVTFCHNHKINLTMIAY